MNSSKDNTTIMNMILSNNEELFQVASNKNAELFDSLWEKYWKQDAIIMRPSGNIMTKDEWKDIVVHSTDVTVQFSNILSVDTIHFFANGKAAVANYTSHEKFTYNGIDNDDVTKVSSYNDMYQSLSYLVYYVMTIGTDMFGFSFFLFTFSLDLILHNPL